MKVYRNSTGFIVTHNGKSESFNDYKDVAVYMYDLGADWSEVEYGLTELITRDDSVAVYGIENKFCYSEKIA